MTIEARSLADITGLAFNPPADPGHSTGLPCPELTLYIAKVPGSRDVFLTPLKPRDRVVNAQDVASSLYFLHVDSLEDSLVQRRALQTVQEAPQDLLSRSVSRKPVANGVVRKPLPTPPASPKLEQQDYLSAGQLSPRKTGVPTRKPIVPPRSPDRGLSPRSGSVAPSLTDAATLSSLSEGPPCQTLTLIRRDPSTGEQWNIAKIRDPPVDEISSDALQESVNFNKRVKNAGSPLYVDIFNDGYSQFAWSDACTPSDSRTSLAYQMPPTPEQRTFKRRLWMGGSRFANHTYSSRDSLSVTSLATKSTTGPTPPGGTSRHSFASSTYDRRTKGYAFHDLWGQKCEFSTAATGRALRCRRAEHGDSPTLDNSSDVSELRFNLPTHHLSSKSESASNTNANDGRRYSYFSHHSGQSNDSSLMTARTRSSFSEDGSIDYSLGREKAGGGFGGREAKLGKLIVYDRGQKMLDLVVAANLALWWRAYERCG